MKIIINNVQNHSKIHDSKNVVSVPLQRESEVPVMSSNINFYGAPVLQGTISNKVLTHKLRLLKTFREILQNSTKNLSPDEIAQKIAKRAYNVLKYKQRKKKELEREANFIMDNNPNAISKTDRLRLERILQELKDLLKIKLYDEPKKNKFEDDNFDFALITLFQSALLGGNFNLRDITSEYYAPLKHIETLDDLRTKYPAIELPPMPIDVIAQKIVSTFTRDVYEKIYDYGKNRKEVEFNDVMHNIVVQRVLDTAKHYEIFDFEIITEIGRKVLNQVSDYSVELVNSNRIKTIPQKRNSDVVVLSNLDLNLLKIDYDDFLLKVIKEHYLNGTKFNNIVYKENGVEIKLADLKDSEYKFEKFSEKVKKMIADAEKIKLLQRDYAKYTVGEFKERLEFYANSKLGANTEIFNLICEFHSCQFTAEDKSYLVKLLKQLDRLFDKEVSLDETIRYIKEHNIKPLGTQKIDALEQRKIKEKLWQEHLVNQSLKTLQDSYFELMNVLYAKNMGQLNEICMKYYPEEANYSVILQSMLVLNFFKDCIDNNEKIAAQTKIMRWDAYNDYLQNESDSEVLELAREYGYSFEPDGIHNLEKDYLDIKDKFPTAISFEDFKKASEILEYTTSKDKVGQYLLNRTIIEGYPESKSLVSYPEVLEKIVTNFENNKNIATEILCKYEDYVNLKDEEKGSILNILQIFDFKNPHDRIILKDIIENDYINLNMVVYVNEFNVPKPRMITPTAKQELYAKYNFPNSVPFFEKFEEALPLNARYSNSPGVKKLEKNNKKAQYKAEIKIMGHDDRLVADNNDYIFNHYLPTGMH